MKKRGVLIKRWSIVLIALLSFVMINSDIVNAPAGCCVNPRYSYLICTDVGSVGECCGSEGSYPGWTVCNATYGEGVLCGDHPSCEVGPGCCIYEDRCSDVLYESQCTSTGGVEFVEGISCDIQPSCIAGCCSYESEGVSDCEYTQYITCLTFDDAGPPDFNASKSEADCAVDCQAVPQGFGDITGTVFNITGELLQGVTVEAGSISAITVSGGTYTLTDVPRGYTTVTFSKAGFGTVYESVNVVIADTVQLDTTLTPTGTAIIKGTISSGATPLVGALVVVNPGGNFDISSESGFYQFVVDAPESYTVTASKTGYSTESESVSVVVEELADVDLFLTPVTPSNITGFVKYNGTELVGAGITVRVEGTAYNVLTNSSGGYRLTSLPPGTYSIYAEAPNPSYNPEFRVVSIGADEVVNIDISLFGITAGVTCTGSGGFCCGTGETCGGSAYTTDDCTACCDVECIAEVSDQDSDFYPDDIEPNCMWEESLHDQPGLPTREGWDLGTCDDGIDNDCDSTGFFDYGPPLIANSEDLLDSDCSFCPANPCDTLNNRWCNETLAQELIQLFIDSGGAEGIDPGADPGATSEVWVLDSPEFDYCSDAYCSEDPVCTSDCQQLGQSCCFQCAGGSEPLDPTTYGGCSESQVCCDVSLGGCESQPTVSCCDFDWSCNGYAVPLDYPDYPLGCDLAIPQTACFASCVIPNCLLDQPIAHLDNVNPDGTLLLDASVCNCQGLRNTTSSPGAVDTGFCCLTGEYDSDPLGSGCPAPPVTGTVRGNVVNTSANPINQVDIQIAGKFVETNIDGDFEIAVVPVGLQTMTASKIGYVTNTTTVDVIPSADGFTEINFILETGVSCSDSVPPPIKQFGVINVQGQKALLLTWNNPCPDEIVGFYIHVVGEGRAENLDRGKDITSILDESVEWDTLYTYTIVAEYEDPFRLSTPVTADGNPGNQLCENRQLASEFCVSQVYDLIKPLTVGIFCDNQNSLIDIPKNCSNTEQGGVDYLCVELHGGVVECREQIECRDVTGGDPFGLYYTPDVCHIDTEPEPDQTRNCYYDYTNTTVDACFSCGIEPSCFDYSSELSCSLDNCGAFAFDYPYDESCTWYDTEYAEFGKGVCFTPYYNDTDQCNKCNRSENQPFDNPVCDFNVCSRLGSCYSEDNGDFCQECSETTECEFFDEKTSCIGIEKYDFILTRNFSIPFFTANANESYDDFNYSLDACGLQRCKWGDPENDGTERCYKDGDDDDVPDCEESTPQDRLCRQDQEAPITSITNIPGFFINSESYNLVLEILGLGDDGTSRFLKNIEIRYCLDKDNSCMPNTSISLSTRKNIGGEDFTINLTLPNDVYNETHIPQGFVHVRFFSKDYHNNTETIKSAGVFIDTIRPDVNVSWSRINDTDDRSNLTLNVTTDTLSDCSVDTLVYVNDPSFIPSENGIESGIGTFFETNYTGLLDGFYYYRVTCEDAHGNKKTVVTNVHIDRIKVIYDERPDTFIPTAAEHEERLNNIFTSNTILFHLKTPSSFGINVACKFFDNVWVDLPFVWPGVDEKGAYREYNLTYTTAGPTTYSFPVECNDTTDNSLLDTTLFRFTVDSLAPTASLGYKDKFGVFHSFNASGFYTPSTKFNLSCEDDDLSAPGMPFPGEAGCEEIRICTDLVCTDPTKYTVYTTPLTFSEDTTFNFSSIDRKDNLEVVNSRLIQIDDDAPNLIIDFPPDNFITDQNPFPLGHPIDGTWTDRSGLKNLKAILTDSESNIRISFININTIEKTFTGNLPILSQGLNNIRLEGEDLAGNIGDTSIDIYLDEVGPEYNHWEVKKTDGTRIDNESSCTTDCFVEWGQDIIFNVSIDDVEWTSIGIQDNGVEVNIDYGPLTWDLELGTTDELDFNTTFMFNPDPGLPGSYFEKPGRWNVIFSATDVFGNQRTKEIWFYVNDTTPPEFTVEILDDLGNPTNFMVRDKTYTINLVSSEPLSSILILKYKPILANEEASEVVTLTDVGGKGFRFTGTTEIPPRPEFDNLQGNVNNAEWLITAFDVNDVEGNVITPKEFIIDTRGPNQPIIENLDEFEYTNRRDIFIAGFTDGPEPDLNVNLRLNNVTENIFVLSDWKTIASTVSAENNDIVSSYRNIKISFDALIGETSVILEGSYGDTVEKYISFKDGLTDIARENLTYYRINHVEGLSGPRTLVNFTPVLEDNILTSYKANIYENEAPTGWFSFDLNTLIEGSNWIYVVGFDNHGVEGEILQENVFDIISDTAKPWFEDERPRDGRVENNNKTNISIKISDIIPVTNVSKINKSSIRLEFNGTSHLCGDGDLGCFPGESFKEEYDLFLDPSNVSVSLFDELPAGEYTIRVTVTDRVGNENTTTWRFTIDPTAPNYPKYLITDAFRPVYLDSDEAPIRYTNNITQDIIANFSSNVSIEEYNLTLNGVQLPIGMNTLEPSYKFNFTPGTILAEEKYTFSLIARKIFNLTPLILGNPLSDEFDIVVDTTEPLVTNLMIEDSPGFDHVERGMNFSVRADVVERSPNALFKWEIRNDTDQIVLESEPLIVEDVQNFESYIFFQVIEPNKTGFVYKPDYGLYTLILKVTDTFGEENITETTFFVNDTIGPKATLTQISSGRITQENHGKTRINTPTIEIVTDEWASSCVALLGAGKDFTTTDNLHFTVKFDVAFILDEGENEFDVRCTDFHDSEEITPMTIFVDTVEPSFISLDWDLDLEIENLIKKYTFGRITNLTVTPSEETICKYMGNRTENMPDLGTIDIEDFYLNDMTNMFTGFDEDFRIVHSVDITAEIESITGGVFDNDNFTYYVACEDEATNIVTSLGVKSIIVDIGKLRITSIGFDTGDETNNVNPTLIVDTDLDSDCRYRNSSDSEFRDFDTGQGTVHHEQLLGPLADNIYIYSVECNWTLSPDVSIRTNTSIRIDTVVSPLELTNILDEDGNAIGARTRSANLTLNGTAEAGAYVEAIINDISYGLDYNSISSDNELFTINVPDISQINGDSEYRIRVKATDNIPNSDESNEIIFTLDTTPPPVPVLWPLQPYTNSENIVVYGKVNEPNVNIIASVDDNNLFLSPNDFPGTAGGISNNITRIELADSSSAGLHQINISDLDFFNVNVGDFIAFENHDPPLFQHYQVTFKLNIPASDKTLLNVSPPLIADVSLGEIFTIFDTDKQTGWFSITPTLEVGDNYVSAKAIDNLNNPSDYDTLQFVIYDNMVPVITVIEPEENEFINDNLTVISARVEDDGVGINTGTIRVTLDGVSYDYPTNMEPDPISDINDFELIFTPTTELSETTHTVKFEASDLAGNFVEKEWTLTVDLTVPSDPSMGVTDGKNTTPKKWFTDNLEFVISANFSENVTINNFNFSDGTTTLDVVREEITTSNDYRFTPQETLTAETQYYLEMDVSRIFEVGSGTPKVFTYEIYTDTEIPAVSNSDILPIVELGNDVTIRVDAEDAGIGIEKAMVDVNGIRYEMGIENEPTYAFTLIEPIVGSYAVRYYINDSLGHMNNFVADSFSVVDTTGPEITEIGPFITNNIFETVSAELSDLSDIDWTVIEMRIRGILLASTGTLSGDIVTYDLTSYYDGTLTYDLSNGKLVYVPSVSLLFPDVETTTLPIAVSASDEYANSNSREWEVFIDTRIPSSPLVEVGTNALEVSEGIDNINYISVPSIVPLTVDFSSFLPDINSLSYVFSNPEKIFSENVDIDAKLIELGLANINEEQYWINISVETYIENLADYRFVFNVDRTTPVFTVSTVDYAGFATIPITVNSSESLPEIDVTVTQNNAGPEQVVMTSSDGITWDGNYVVKLGFDGPASVNATGSDAAGNAGKGSATFVVDTIEPFVNIDTMETPTNVATVTITGTTDAATAKLYVDDSFVNDVIVTDGAFATSYLMATEKIYKIEIIGFDLANNNNSAFQEVAYDATVPVIVSVTPADATIHQTVTEIIAELDDGTGVGIDFTASTTTLNNGTSISGTLTNSGNNLIFAPDITLGDGDYGITTTITDLAGNSVTQTTSFTINTEFPDITIASPSLPTIYVNNAAFTTTGTIAAAGTKTITSAYLNDDGIIINLLDYMVGDGFSYDITLDTGNNNLVYNATDNVGLTAEKTKQIILDIVLPSIDIDNMDTTVSFDEILVTGTFNDNYPINTGAIKIKNNANGQELDATLSGNSFSVTMSLKEGINVINATIVDRAGNNNYDTITIIKDTGLPVITIGQPEDQFKTNLESITVSGTAISTYTTDGTIVEILRNGNLQETLTTGADGVFSTFITLDPGTNIITVIATNTAGQSSLDSVTGEYDLIGPVITLLRPNTVPENSFNAFTPLGSNIPVILETDESASCTLQKPGESVWSFSTDDNIRHELIYTPELTEGRHDFNINCSDNFDNPTSEVMRLTVDFGNPFVFNVNADPNPVILQTETLSNFTANTNELTRCKYINNDNITEKGLNINNQAHRRSIFELGRFFDSSVNYLTSHSHALRDSDLRQGLNGNYTFYVMCEDKAERLSFTNPAIELEVNVNWDLEITSKGPEGVVNDPSPELFVDTNLDATCTAVSEDQTFFEQLLVVLFGPSPLEGPYKHTVQLPLSTPFYEGDYEHDVTYTYTVDCQAVDNPAKTASTTISFTTDFVLASPIIDLISPVPGSTVTTPNTFIDGAIISAIEITSANLTLNDVQFWNLYIPNDGNLLFNVSVTLIEGLNNFTIMAITDLSEFAADETYSVTLDTTGPEGVIEIGG